MKRSTFDQRFKEALEIRRMTQTELHERTGISKGSISTYLKGTWKPKQDKVDLIAQALRVDPAWLMGYDVPMDAGEPDHIDEDEDEDDGLDDIISALRSNEDLRLLARKAIKSSNQNIKTATKVLSALDGDEKGD